MMIVVMMATHAQGVSALCEPCAGHFPCGTGKVCIVPCDGRGVGIIILEENLRPREGHSLA